MHAVGLLNKTCTCIVLVDFPHTAAFLTPEERAYIVHRKSTFPTVHATSYGSLTSTHRIRQLVCGRGGAL